MSQEPDARGTTGRLRAEFDGKPVYFWLLIGLAIAAVVLSFGAWWTAGDADDDTGGSSGAMAGMGGTSEVGGDVARFPPVFGYHGGDEIWFVHTEASDEQVADMLTMMMGSPVLVVPNLAMVPAGARATVYVFTNGIEPDEGPTGPFGFQPDVFDNAPGNPDYTPLREVVLVTWRDDAEARVLRSAEQVAAAETAGELALEATGVVVNMPFLVWPDGER